MVQGRNAIGGNYAGQALGQGATDVAPRGWRMNSTSQPQVGLGQGMQLRTVDPDCPAYQDGAFRGR
jgi:hypothetical protein